MNLSGRAIRQVMAWHKWPPESILVIYDDAALPLGRLRFREKGSAGGHNGVKSIEKALKTKEYVRVRIGISGATPSGKLKRPAPEKLADFVLAKFRPPEQEKLKKAKKTVAEALELILEDGVQAAMTETNAK